MARDSKLYVRIADDQTLAQLARAGFSAVADGDWLHMFGDDDCENAARQLSMMLATTTVSWSIDSIMGELSLVCFHYGVQVRKIHYSVAAGWSTVSGRGQPFEGKALAYWLGKRHLRVSPDGYDVLECFLGRNRPPEPYFAPRELSGSPTVRR